MKGRFGGAAARSSVPVSSRGNYRPGRTQVLSQALGAVSPTERGRVGSGYGERTSSRTGRTTFHAGWDFVAPRGTPIYAADAGEVVHVAREQPGGPFRGYGNTVVTYHPEDDTYVLYAHLHRAMVQEGEHVLAGEQIGEAGNTTNGKFPRMPPHLHLEVRRPKEDGSSPFPGRYGRYNLDPLDWFERRGLGITNRWSRPPGTLGPSSSGGGTAGLGQPPWWETTFYLHAPPDARYEPHQEGNELWDWAPAIAGFLLFNVSHVALYGRLPTLYTGRRRGR